MQTLIEIMAAFVLIGLPFLAWASWLCLHVAFYRERRRREESEE